MLQTQHVNDAFDRVIDALHLLHDEMVAYPFVVHGEGNPPNFSHGSSGWAFPSNQAWQRALRYPYTLPPSEKQDLRQLAELLERLQKGSSHGVIALVLGRLSATHHRTDDSDRIVDSAIALEAVLLKNTEDELSYREALRGAHLLGATPDERRELFTVFKQSYSRRSKIVHGQTDPGEPKTALIMSMTRKVIRRFVESMEHSSHADLIRNLDEAAIRGSSL